MKQSNLLSWKNVDDKEIVVMIIDQEDRGVVVHSDGIMAIGSTIVLSDMKFNPFVGTVHITSHAEGASSDEA